MTRVVVGIEPSAAVIDRARALTADPNCTYTVGIAEALPYADGSFDVVANCLVLHHLPEEVRPAALAGMRRVLRPGGRLLIGEFRPPENAIGRRVVGALTGPAMRDNPIERLEPLVAAAGFEEIRSGDLRPWIRWVTAVRTDAAAPDGTR